MKNLTNIFLNSAPSRIRLDFGVNGNVVLKAVTNEERRGKDNLKLDKSCFMRFAKLDPEDSAIVVAESEFSYFGLSKKEYATENFIHQYTQLSQIMRYVVPSEKYAETKQAFMQTLKDDAKLFITIKELRKKKKHPDATTMSAMKELQKKVSDAFVTLITPHAGLTGKRVNLLIVTGPNGKFLDLPREDVGFINADGAKTPLRVDAKYIRWYDKRNEKETAASDVLGEELEISMDSIDLGGDNQELEGL